MRLWRTDDMSLAAFLSVELEVEPECEWEGGSCYYEFERTEDLIELVGDFVSDCARVSPREYNMAFSKIKKKTFSAKGAHNVRRAVANS